MTEYSVESAIEAARSAISAMERIERDISRVNKHHLTPFGLETRLATETDPCSMYHHANAFNLNRQLWRNHFKQLDFLSQSGKIKLKSELGFDDRKSDWQKNLFWERLDILDRLESDRQKHLEALEQGPSFDIQLKLSIEGGLTVEGDTKPHREIFKRHALSWFGPDLKWYVRGARGKPLTNELFVTAYELVKDLSRDGVTVSLTIEGEHVFPVLGDAEKAPAIPIEPKLIEAVPVQDSFIDHEPKKVAKLLTSAKIVQLQPKATSETMPEEPKKIIKQGLKIVNTELKGYVHPTIALREQIREKLKKSCPEIRSSATTADGSFFVRFHAETLEPLTIRLGVNEVAIKERRSTILAAASEDPAKLYADLESSIKSYIAENLKPIEISGERFYASFRLDYFSVVDLSDRVNEPRTIPTGRQKMALIRAYNWAAGRGGKLQHLSYEEFVETLKTATGVRSHSYCAMD